MTERKPSLKEIKNIRIEIDRLNMEDLIERELNNLYENLLEEIIQSDFEQPSIPEVILAVITDLTKDEVENSIYYFNPDDSTNNELESYYTRMHQTVKKLNDHDTSRSTNSSDQSINLIPTNELLVKYFIKKRKIRLEKLILDSRYTSSNNTNNKKICWTQMGKKPKLSQLKSTNHRTIINYVQTNGNH